jgi:hypothetical protein
MRQCKLVTLLGGACLAWPSLARADEDPQKLADLVIRRLGLQTEFPRVPEPFRFRLQVPQEVVWIVVIIAICAILYAFRDEILALLNLRRQGAWSQDGSDAADAGARSPEATLVAADELAAHGRFVDAMHALLLQALAYMRERLDEQFADSLTSREIVYSTKLPSDGRASLQDIVTRVEWTYFGERPATKTDYEACRASFTALAQSLHRKAAA